MTRKKADETVATHENGFPREPDFVTEDSGPPSTERQPGDESERPEGYLAKFSKRKQYSEPSQKGELTLDLTSDHNGPRARLLRVKGWNERTKSQEEFMWIQFSKDPGKEFTRQIAQANFDWEARAQSDFAKGAWVLPLDPDRKWQGHTHAQNAFYDIVNQIREKSGMDPFVPGAAQSV